MGAAVAHTFVLLRPLGRTLLGVPSGLDSPGSRSGGIADVVGLQTPRGRLFAAPAFLGRTGHPGPVEWLGPVHPCVLPLGRLLTRPLG